MHACMQRGAASSINVHREDTRLMHVGECNLPNTVSAVGSVDTKESHRVR